LASLTIWLAVAIPADPEAVCDRSAVGALVFVAFRGSATHGYLL